MEEALRNDGSLFTPGATIWSAENIDDLYKRFVGNPDESSDSFEDKFCRQLEGASPETRQLAAEVLYVYLLFPLNIGGGKKRQIIRRVLDGTSVALPDDLGQSLDHGLANYGPALQHRPWQLTMLLEFLRKWKKLPDKEKVLSDPWKFKEIVFSVPHERAGVQREALLHLVHPDTFERIVGRDHKRYVARCFSYLTDGSTQDVDRRILEIREGLAPKYGEDFDFYDDELKRLWLSEENGWDAFVKWAKKFYEWEGFEENERDFKLEIAARLKRAKNALLGGEEDWTKRLREAFWARNNLIFYMQRQDFLKWCETSTEAAGEALRALWDESSPILERVGRFSELLPRKVLSGSGGRLALASVLSLADDPMNNPVYRWEPLYKAQKLLGDPAAESGLDEAGLYEHAIGFIDRFLEEAEHRGLKLRDRLDAQSLIWCVSKWSANEEPVRSWSESERRAFLKYRGETDDDEELADLVSRFREERSYPTQRDEEHMAAREAFVEDLSPEAVKNIDWDRFIYICQTPKAGATGGVPGLIRYIQGSDEEELERLRRAVEHLLYAELPLEQRLDNVLTGEFRVNNFGEVVATKLLSICLPDRVLPIFASEGSKGKAALMRHPALGLELPKSASRGGLAVGANDLLRERLAPYFGDDTHGMKEFLYWLQAGDGQEEDGLRDLAQELLLDHDYLSRVDLLLKDKRQIIFYGPPGTGKTFVARRLARLYGEGSGGSSLLVQFHPSYSYEDFVEGYRPRAVGDQPGFALVDGPLKKLASRASENPDGKYVLVIDEVNRANLTKVMGELYFLLEYRGESVSLQYSDEPFSLPENLWIVCTMNTADRSIALVDAALRRRFYFASFFPDEPPVKGLLRRWLEDRNHSLLWVADVVDEANRRLGDRQVAVGPSYFLREDLSEEWVEIIWEHAVLPYLSEQFFDEEERLEEFALHTLRSAVDGAGERGADEPPDPT